MWSSLAWPYLTHGLTSLRGILSIGARFLLENSIKAKGLWPCLVDAHLVTPCVWLPEATIYFHKSSRLVSSAEIVMHCMENGGGNGTFISWAWLGSTRISRQVLSRWSWRQGRRMTKLCRSTTPPRVLRRAEHEGLCTPGKNHNGWTWTGWAGGCWWAVGREGSTTVTKVADSLFWQRSEPRVLCMLGSGGRPSSHTAHYSILRTWGRSRSLQQYLLFFRNWFSICSINFRPCLVRILDLFDGCYRTQVRSLSCLVTESVALLNFV